MKLKPNEFVIIDKRSNSHDKNMSNRQRFIEKHKDQIREQVRDAVNKRSIKDTSGDKINISGNTDEPTFDWDRDTGEYEFIYSGNPGYITGDIYEKNKGGKGSGRKAGRGDSQDDFSFFLTEEEYLNILFGDLELPDMIKESDKSIVTTEKMRTGYRTTGPSSLLDLKRTYKNSLGRRLATLKPVTNQIKELEDELEQALLKEDKNEEDALLTEVLILELESKLESLRRKKSVIPFIDTLDLKYKRYSDIIKPTTQAVCFFVLDVSGSMGQKEKEIAKRFFLLTYLFLKRSYENIDIVFIKHTDKAWECDEDEFFHARDSGGTLFSPVVDLINKIINERYPLDLWNIYVAEASDGDNDSDDNITTKDILDVLIPKCQYYIYIETTVYNGNWAPSSRKMWESMDDKFENFCQVVISKEEEVLPVFRQIFMKKKGEAK